MILESLAGATYDELIDDYMVTYDNYYGINKEKDLEKYTIIKEKLMDTMLEYVVGTKDLKNVNYQEKVKEYLVSIGMKKDVISRLESKLIKD